ncbi:MAG: hypothetical protein M1819_001639 [Sarea resinae]|nr:MAG: hypothetical protein M1819_001639 [Sarea resinae]
MAQPGAQPAALALDGGDPRLSFQGMGIQDYSHRQIRSLHDPNVTLEEYMHYAVLSRAEDVRLHGANAYLPGTAGIAGKIKWHHSLKEAAEITNAAPGESLEKSPAFATTATDEKRGLEPGAVGGTESPSEAYLGVPNEEWNIASRAARTATWGAVFYLITTDILGPSSVPWAMSQLGYGPGITLYFVFGATAFYAGFQMWQMFMVLDSTRYPLKTYGDIAFRIFGAWARHTVNVLQSIQLFFNVGILILSNGQAIYQLSQGSSGKKGLCFIVCSLVFTLAGFLLGQVRTLRRFGWIANLAIWLNVIVIIMTMAVAAKDGPNYAVSHVGNLTPLTPEPVRHTAGIPKGVDLQNQLVGLMQAVYSYGGAMLYCEFMSEMKKPWDFFKAQLCAETFIFCCYVLYGIFVYYYQGQYTYIVANQGIQGYNFQSAGNALSLVSALIAAALYGNIGIKVLYQNVFTELMGAPPLESKKGKLLWVGLVPIYWSLAFMVCSAIPNINGFSGVIAAACIMQFSYTFPPFLMLGLDVQRDAMVDGETFDPRTGQVNHVDAGWKRWARGFKKRTPLKMWYIVFTLGSATTAVLGLYCSISSLKTTFDTNPNTTSFSCTAPV